MSRPGELHRARVAIVGLGLMGGSLAGALRGRCREVVGVARRGETIELALARGLIDRGTTELSEGVGQADVVVLATPVRTIVRQIAEIGPLLPGGCLLMDLGSAKVPIVAEMARLPEWVEPLGGHPMCGREVSGVEAAELTLYRGATFILTPLPRTSDAALALGCQLAEAVGSRPLIMDAERHDRLVAVVSHLPYLMASALVGTADAAAAFDPLVWQVAATGFNGCARLAGSDVVMMLDILLTNRQAVLRAVSDFQDKLGELARLVEAVDETELRARLSAARKTYVEKAK